MAMSFGNKGAVAEASRAVADEVRVVTQAQTTAKTEVEAQVPVPAEPLTEKAVSVIPAPAAPTAIQAFQPAGTLALFDFASDPFALMDMNNADQNLGQTLPARRIEYCASTGTEGLTKGLITDTSTMEQKVSVRSVLVAMRFSRVYMPDYDPTSDVNEPLCVSQDGSHRTKGTDTRIPDEQPCVSCPHAKWQPGQKHPDCSEVYTLLLLDVDDQDTPFLFNIRRTGIKPLRVARNAIKAAGLRVMQGGIPGNLFVQFVLFAQAEKNYYVPTFCDIETVSVERAMSLAQRLAPIIQTFHKQDTTETLLDDVEEAGSDAHEPEPGETTVLPPSGTVGTAARRFGNR